MDVDRVSWTWRRWGEGGAAQWNREKNTGKGETLEDLDNVPLYNRDLRCPDFWSTEKVPGDQGSDDRDHTLLRRHVSLLCT